MLSGGDSEQLIYIIQKFSLITLEFEIRVGEGA